MILKLVQDDIRGQREVNIFYFFFISNQIPYVKIF